MLQEKSVGAIVVNSAGKYLLLERADKKANFWEFPKGHKKKGELNRQTLARELAEECKIKKFKLKIGFTGRNEYINSKGRLRIVLLYLVEVNSNKIVLSKEHHSYGWFGFKKCLAKLNHENWKKILVAANKKVAK